MTRILSGIQPSGNVHLGNYLGAMRRWGQLAQDTDNDCFFFIPNLHALSNRLAAKELAERTMSAVAWLLAVGIDYQRSYIYVQSMIPAHSELMWILSNYVSYGELSRMTQFKDKSRKSGSEGQPSGLLYYPVLMAADILLYDPDEVPVGEDQLQHVEITRDIAERFNKLHGPTFKLPRATVQDKGSRIMDLQDPTKKMSKSDGPNNAGCLFLTDSAEDIERKISRAVTDSSGQVKAGHDQPALTNLLNIYSLLTDKSISAIQKQYSDKGYKEFKADLSEVVIKALDPINQHHQDLMADRNKLLAIIQQGSERAASLADGKLLQVKATLGLI